jgi:hypothetical protein
VTWTGATLGCGAGNPPTPVERFPSPPPPPHPTRTSDNAAAPAVTQRRARRPPSLVRSADKHAWTECFLVGFKRNLPEQWTKRRRTPAFTGEHLLESTTTPRHLRSQPPPHVREFTLLDLLRPSVFSGHAGARLPCASALRSQTRPRHNQHQRQLALDRPAPHRGFLPQVEGGQAYRVLAADVGQGTSWSRHTVAALSLRGFKAAQAARPRPQGPHSAARVGRS